MKKIKNKRKWHSSKWYIWKELQKNTERNSIELSNDGIIEKISELNEKNGVERNVNGNERNVNGTEDAKIRRIIKNVPK